MKRYCFDTSAISNPLERMPEDIYWPIWAHVMETISSGSVAVTTEIYEEMTHIGGSVGACIKSSEALMVLELTDDSWDWQLYAETIRQMVKVHREFISEYNGHSKKTICLNDLSIIALAKTLGLPVVSMESEAKGSTKHKRIPDICFEESVEHLTFNDFLRRENFRLTGR